MDQQALTDQQSAPANRKVASLPTRPGPRCELDEHKDARDLTQLREYALGLEEPLAIDLFSGAGGLSLGLERAGFKVVLGVDKDPNAVLTHKAYFGGAAIERDLSKASVVTEIVTALDGVQIDLVAGGPPCQPFSRAGRSKIRSLIDSGAWEVDSRRELWRNFVHVVDALGPRAVLVENVPDMALGHDAIVLRRMVGCLEDLGYDVYSRILAARCYGVPQYRQRLILVAVQEGLPFEWPEPVPGREQTLEDAISDLRGLKAGSKEPVRAYGGPESDYQRWCRGDIREEDQHVIFDHVARDVRSDDLEAYKLMNEKTLYTQLPAHLRRYNLEGPVKFRDRYKMLAWNKPSRTITAHLARDGYWYIHPTDQRTLSVREAARLQSFPDWFRFAGTPTRAYKQIGEAVPPRLGEALGRTILRSLEGAEVANHRATTTAIASKLQAWLAVTPEREMAAPWRRGENPWQVLLGVVLFEKAPQRVVEGNWSDFRKRWKKPKDFLADPHAEARVACIASTWTGARNRTVKRENGRALDLPDLPDGPAKNGAGSVRKVTTIAPDNVMAILTQVANALDGAGRGYGGEEFQVPGISPERLQMALAVCGIGHRLPAFAPAVRVAERVFGERSRWRQPERKDADRGARRDMDGQLLLARLVGVDDHGKAFAAALEIGERLCRPEAPNCGACPLKTLCAVGQGRVVACPPLLVPEDDELEAEELIGD